MLLEWTLFVGLRRHDANFLRRARQVELFKLGRINGSDLKMGNR